MLDYMDFEYVTLEDWHKICKRIHRRIQAGAYSNTPYTHRQMYSPDVIWITGGHRDIEVYRHVGVVRHMGMYGLLGIQMYEGV